MALTRKRIIGGVAAMAMAAGATVFMLSGGPTTHQVPVGASLQEAINNAEAGDTIVLQAGAVYGPVTLSKANAVDVTIQSSRAAELPAGQRVGPAQSPLFAKIQSAVNGEQVIKTVAGAKGYKFIGVEVSTTTASVAVFDLVKWGEDKRTQTTLASVPSNLSIDRSWVHGWPTQNVQRGLAMNCASCEVTNSYVSDIHWIGQDSQAIAGWNGTNNVRIINNYLEGAGENVMFGGADAAIAEMIPSNIEIRNNYFFKPLTWKVGHATYGGIHWTIKNLLELKNARNVTIDGNTFENCWGDAQIGYAVLFTVRNQDGTNPWATIENVTFTNNVVENSEQGFQLLGMDNLQPSQRASGLTITNNLFEGITNRWLTMNGYNNVTIEHNTHMQGGNITLFNGAASTGFVYRNNVTVRDPKGFGVFGDAAGEGTVALTKFTPQGIVAGNVIAGLRIGSNGATFDWTRSYPTGNNYPLDLSGLATFKGTDGLTPGYSTSLATPTPSATPSPSVSLPSPTATATPTGTPTPAPLPSPSPTPTSTPVPTATPTPQPSPSLPKCAANQIIGNPARCICTTGVRCTGNNARCL